MSRYIGTAVNTQPTQSSAAGVYTLKDQLVYNTREQWPVGRDPYFNYTTLLLQGDVPYTRGRNPMTLPLAYNSDASTNNFLVTPNGDVGPKPFSPYFGGNYSVYFPGSSSTWIGTPDNAALELGANDFTIECWVYNDVNFSAQRIISSKWNQFVFGINTTPALILAWYGTSTSSSTGTLLDTSVNKWHHFAVCRSGSTLYAFQNGQRLTLTNSTITGTLNNDATGPIIGGNANQSGGVITAANDPWTGYISNYRLVNGTALYTAPFTPSTQPLQNIPNTSLLTCQSNRFIDNSTANSGSGWTLTVTGSPRITDNSPFVSTDFTTGAGYFKGAASDYLSVADNSAWDFAGQFSVELSVYFNSTSSPQTFLSHLDALPGNGFFFRIASGNLEFGYGDGAGSFSVTASFTIVTGTWFHLLATRDSGNTIRLFSNGVMLTNIVQSKNMTGSTGLLEIGRQSPIASWYFNGYMSNIRIVNGSVPTGYQTSSTTNGTQIFTPPAAALTTTSQGATAGDVKLLTLQTRAPSQNIGFIDSSPNEFIVTKNGNTTQGTFTPFSPTGWGNYFNGSSQYLTTPSGTVDFSTNQFCIETWVYFNSLTATTSLFGTRSGDATTTIRWGLLVDASASYKIYFSAYSSSNTFICAIPSDAGLSIGRWYHIAVSRDSSNVIRLFVDGVAQTSTVTSGAAIANSVTAVNIGMMPGSFGGTGGPLNGYLSNIRIVNNQALYTGNFTPPTAALTTTSVGTSGTNVASSITGTVALLTCQSNRFLDQTGKTITVTGSPSVQAFSPFAPANAVSPLVTGGSGYFDGTTDYLTVPDSPVFTLGTSDFTIEAWVYSTLGTGADRYIAAQTDNSTATGSAFALYTRSADAFILFEYYSSSTTASITSGAAITLNQWNHIVVCRSGGTLSMFVNGVRPAAGTTSIGSTSINDSAASFSVGARSNGNNAITGYIAASRFVRGADIYGASNTNIVVPTTPPTAIPNTSLLLNFTNGAAVDATGKNNLESVGNAQNSGVQAKWDYLKGGSSMYFDGTDDRLVAPANQNNSFGTGDFTIEYWVYPNNVSAASNQGMVQTSAATGGLSTTLTNGVFIAFGQGSSAGTGSDGGVYARINNNHLGGNAAATTGSWQHIALCRASGTARLFVNGSQIASLPNSSDVTATNLVVGGYYSTSFLLNGYLSNLRITKYARYTANFNTNLPTGPFPRG